MKKKRGNTRFGSVSGRVGNRRRVRKKPWLRGYTRTRSILVKTHTESILNLQIFIHSMSNGENFAVPKHDVKYYKYKPHMHSSVGFFVNAKREATFSPCSVLYSSSIRLSS